MTSSSVRAGAARWAGAGEGGRRVKCWEGASRRRENVNRCDEAKRVSCFFEGS